MQHARSCEPDREHIFRTPAFRVWREAGVVHIRIPPFRSQEIAHIETALCPICNTQLDRAEVRTAIWQADRLVVVENIPALVCRNCAEQFYDDDVSEALRKLGEDGFPETEARNMIEVPVFSLEGRIRQRKPLPEDTYVD